MRFRRGRLIQKYHICAVSLEKLSQQRKFSHIEDLDSQLCQGNIEQDAPYCLRLSLPWWALGKPGQQRSTSQKTS